MLICVFNFEESIQRLLGCRLNRVFFLIAVRDFLYCCYGLPLLNVLISLVWSGGAFVVLCCSSLHVVYSYLYVHISHVAVDSTINSGL